MKKTDLISSIFNSCNISKSDSKNSVEAILQKITDAISSGEGVEVRGFGGFSKKHRKARLGINPKTGERTQVEEKYVPVFKPGKSLKDSVNKSNV
jgi:integration host factor subunit beta